MDPDSLVAWFTAHSGTFDRAALTFAQIDKLGWGAFALRDLQQGHTLFSLPHELTLSTRTSSLPPLIGEQDWKKYDLHIGWAGLILCLMWEAAQGESSKWSTYLASLPISFDTPMFWGSEDLEKLKGTAILDKIGKEQAENDYANKVVPILKSRMDLFGAEHPNPHFSLEAYHIMGSRILSRSFQVEAQPRVDGSYTPVLAHEDPEMGLTNSSSLLHGNDDTEDIEHDMESDDGDDGDPANVAMVPMADMLNARYGCANAKLFYESRDLRMVTTRSVRQGEQIWNTYGDPPNSDLLRRYGHVDQVPLANGGLGNPADIVEIRADLVMEVIVQNYRPECAGPRSTERVDWWLEEGGDDVFVVDSSNDVPEDMSSFVRLLMMSAAEWEKTKQKAKLPKPKEDKVALSVTADVVRRRLTEYPTTIEDDEAWLGAELVPEKPIPLNLKHAIVVRLGEMRILRGLLREVTARLESSQARTPPQLSASTTSESRKRKADGTGTSGGGRTGTGRAARR
ncbi:SET domain-containing protein [Lactarius quietus]|nr:SET domain-containing protein [Lactarius quietus]KAF8268604.1 SET domain-containing protein [Lactarius quietus]